MAKIKKEKKKNLRARQQIRRTLGTLFLISAIVVAAIPVGQLEAAKVDQVGSDSADALPADTRGNASYSVKQPVSPGAGTTEDIDFTEGGTVMYPNLSAGANQIYDSYNIRRSSDNQWTLSVQFKYFVLPNTGTRYDGYAIISDYVSIYPETTVTLMTSTVADYFTVTIDEYNKFYTDSGSPGNKDYILYYLEYINHEKNGAAATADMTFMETYFPDDYQNFAAACERYYKYLQDYAAWQNDSSLPRPAEVVKPDDTDGDYNDNGGTPENPLTLNPSIEFTPEEKSVFYCKLLEAQGKLPGKGYHLEMVSDQRPSATSPGTGGIGETPPNERVSVYVAMGGEPLPGVGGYSTVYNDPNKFLVIAASRDVAGIGNNAFADVRNVDVLTIPAETAYIGDEAFLNSFIDSITIENVEYIGNRAFKGCQDLAKVDLRKATHMIGTESFAGCTKLSSITLPNTVAIIGPGAFYNCQALQTVELNEIKSSCEIGKFAFYNCIGLNTVNMSASLINKIGEGTFAVQSSPTGRWAEATLPPQILGGDLGNYLFEGRTNLEIVHMPSDYGTTQSGTLANNVLPSGMFRNCTNLKYVEFPVIASGGNNCGYMAYGPTEANDGAYGDSGAYVFLDVTNPDFYVKGPARSLDGNYAKPRTSTWKAFTRVSDFVPYIYMENGVECYEVSDGTYILQANATGELASCTLVDPEDSTTPIDLVIPNKVGAYDITSIGATCFTEEALRNRIRSITIADDSVQELAPRVFAGLNNLEWVVIGNSVNKIGERAFYECPKLIDITFNAPPEPKDYTKLTIGTEAFLTDSDELTMHGDIDTAYAPFVLATGKDSGIIDSDSGKRICYKSLAPDFLTVMYDNGTGEVTLLEYPKFANLDKDHAEYLRTRERYFYDRYSGSEWDDERAAFYKEVVTDSKYGNTINWADEGHAVYQSDYYGPWLNSAFVAAVTGAAASPGPTPTATPPYAPNTRFNNFKPYFGQFPYSIISNYYNKQPVWDFETSTDDELEWVNGTVNIVVPAGVTSIDAKNFFAPDTVNNPNSRNIITYFNTSSSNLDYQMVVGAEKTETVGDVTLPVIGGLFSGKYLDYEDRESDEEAKAEEVYVKGNDHILSVVLSTVKKLPDYAFDSCENLQNVVLGPAMADIGTAPFRGCTALTTVGGNANYITEPGGIIYSVNADQSLTIEECLAARGNLAPINASTIDLANDPNLAKVSSITDGAFDDCDYLSTVDLTAAKQLKVIPESCFNNCELLYKVTLPESVRRVEENAFGGMNRIHVTIPAREVDIDTDAFLHEPTCIIETYEDTSAHDYTTYYGLGFIPLASKFMVAFVDYNSTLIAATDTFANPQYLTAGQSATPPANPVREGFLFTGWQPDYNNVQSDLTVIAQYSPLSADENKFSVSFYDEDGTTLVGPVQRIAKGESAVAPMPPSHSGRVFKGWIPNTYTNVQADLTIRADYDTADSNSSSSATASPTSSGSPSPSPTPNVGTKYTVSVSGGSGSGSYAAGTVVTISAYATGDGKIFDRWTTASTGVGFQNAESPMTSFTMPAGNVTVTATYKTALSSDSGGGSAASNSSGGTNSTGTSSTDTGTGSNYNSNATVQITKPGIPNTDLAAATVNGSLDNFVIKISEDAAATASVIEALQKEYGDISNIRYLPMDISLYDATGTTKITDTAGLSINISIPLPSELISYAGNNKVATAAGGTLENLTPRFSTVNGVPCINFVATHFSPYVVYVDTANLGEGIADYTPQTGDFLHPKWFLVIGLFSMSLLLFLKKDKVSRVRPA